MPGSLKNYRDWFNAQRIKGHPGHRIVCQFVPQKIGESGYRFAGRTANNSERVRKHNVSRFISFQETLEHGKQRLFVIAMPRTLHYLLPCIWQLQRCSLPDPPQFVLVLNGISPEERRLLDTHTDAVKFELSLAVETPMSHGQVLNILFDASDSDFVIVDHDLYGVSSSLLSAMMNPTPEFMRGTFAIRNPALSWLFPRTHLLSFNVAAIRKLMTKWQTGAQQYRKLPRHLMEIAALEGLERGQALKPYLQYFDSLNALMLLIRHEGGILEFPDPDLERSLAHVGGTSGKGTHNSDLLGMYADLCFLELVNLDEIRNLYGTLQESFASAAHCRAYLLEKGIPQEHLRRIDSIVSVALS